ncbi:MAG: cyclic nucleotide-binding domain-containing protein [Pseudomonadota bacterium]
MADVDSLSLPLRDAAGAITEKHVMGWLEESQVFSSLSVADLKPLLQNLQILNFKPMDEVIVKDHFSAALYIVIAGRFLVLRPENTHVHSAADPDDLAELDTFIKGQCFGEYSLIDRKPASASVVAAERSQAIQIPRRAFESLMMSDYRIAKTVYHNLLLLLTARLRRGLKV